MPNWAALGWEADDEVAKSFAWATHQHASLLNAKWTDIPEPYVDPLNDLLQATGHRFAISAVVHPEYISAGDSLNPQVTWENYGSTPAYRSRPLTYRLVGNETTVSMISEADIRTWLPGAPIQTSERIDLSTELPPGRYTLEVGLLERPAATRSPHHFRPLNWRCPTVQATGFIPSPPSRFARIDLQRTIRYTPYMTHFHPRTLFMLGPLVCLACTVLLTPKRTRRQCRLGRDCGDIVRRDRHQWIRQWHL